MSVRIAGRNLLAFAVVVGAGCGGDDGTSGDTGDETSGMQFPHDPDACTEFQVPNHFGFRWENLNHRLSVWDMALDVDGSGCEGTSLAVGMIGGDFTQGAGISDNAFVRYGWMPVASEEGGPLGAARTSFSVALTPEADHAHEATVTLSRADLELEEYDDVTAFVGGLGLDTSSETQPPDFPDGYDPAHGYVVRGLGMGVQVTEVTADEVTLVWSIRLEPGLSDDRPDLNDAIPHAVIGARLDVVLVGVSGASVRTGSVDYQNDYAKQEVGMEVLLEHPTEEQQTIEIAGDAGAGSGVYGLTRFDWQFDPEELDGGGHYMREFDIRLAQSSYDDDTGAATFLMDGFASNSSQVITSFALRSHFTGSMAWLQAEGGAAPKDVMRERMPGYTMLPLD